VDHDLIIVAEGNCGIACQGVNDLGFYLFAIACLHPDPDHPWRGSGSQDQNPVERFIDMRAEIIERLVVILDCPFSDGLTAYLDVVQVSHVALLLKISVRFCSGYLDKVYDPWAGMKPDMLEHTISRAFLQAGIRGTRYVSESIGAKWS
jgi:hypothetical protein